MQRLFVKGCILGLLVLLSNLGIVYVTGYAPYAQAWQVNERFERLEDGTARRIIVVGGSSNVFGIDSQILEDRLGREVLNMGLTAPYGAGLMLNQTGIHANPGDIIVLSLEYSHFFGENFYGYGTSMRFVAGIRPEILSYIQYPQQVRTLLAGYSRQTRRSIEFWLKTSNKGCLLRRYCEGNLLTVDKDSLNLTFYPERHPLEDINVYFHDPEDFNPQAITYVNDFYREMQTKGVSVVMLYPPHPIEVAYKYPKSEQIATVKHAYETILEVPIIGNHIDVMQPIANFWDTSYHLSPVGRQYHSVYVARKLQAYLQSKN